MPPVTCVAPLQVVTGIVWRRGRFLAAQRPRDKALGGYWEFPGGKVEAGESLEQALIRELREEAAIDAETVVYWKSLEYKYPQGPVLLHFFHVTAFAGDVRALEGQTLRWAYPDEALQWDFLPPDLPLLQELADDAEVKKQEFHRHGETTPCAKGVSGGPRSLCPPGHCR